MQVKCETNLLAYRWGVPVFATVLAMGGIMAQAQSTELPSNPNPNPSSLVNPYYGSVTLHPAKDGVVRLTLDEAVQQGFAANLGLKNYEENEKSLHGGELEALQLFLPTISAKGSTGYNQYNLEAFGFGPGVLAKIDQEFPGQSFGNISFITKADVTTGQITYDQTLISGQVLDGYKAVRAAEKSAYFAKQRARGEVVQQVADAYLGIIADRSQVENAKALLDADKVLSDQAHEKHVAGTVANLDELRAKVQYQQQEQVVLADENQLAKDEILLKREIGIGPGQQIELTDPNPYNELTLLTPEELLTVAYESRQDYQNLQAQLREAKMILGARRAERYPTLSFKGNYGVTEVSGIGSHGTLAAVGTLSVPIFREATIRGDSDVAKAQLLGTDQQLTDLRQKIDQQVRSALLDTKAALDLVKVARSNVELASQSLSDETDRFKAGVDDTLPLVQAQATLQSAQTNLVRSLYQYNVTKLALARATGVLELQYRTYLGK